MMQESFVSRNLVYVLGMFTANLTDEDSYMYLTAVKGLVAVGNAAPARVLPVLANEFRLVKGAVASKRRVVALFLQLIIST